MTVLPGLLATLPFLSFQPRVEAADNFIRGDVDASGVLDVTDPVRVLGHLFLGDPSDLGCDDAADVDDSGVLDISDPVYLLGHLFLGGPEPVKPYPDCGTDRTDDALSCRVFDACANIFCGGIAGIPCGEGMVCDPPAGACGGADLPGECVPLPEFCEKIFKPVCGCDGITYPNDCERLRAGIPKDHDGECTTARRCGGADGIVCPQGEFCDLPAGSCDPDPVADGECRAISPACPPVFEPVCGCDDVTYMSDCERIRAGVQKKNDGECTGGLIFCGGVLGQKCPPGWFCDLNPGPCEDVGREGVCVEVLQGCPENIDPVCGCDGVTYSNDCERIRAGAQKAHDGECGAPRVCGGLLGLPCDPGEYCEFPEGTCDVSDNQGVCVVQPKNCPGDFDPVCGCDGVTYTNDCERQAAAAQKAHDGPCEPPKPCGGLAGEPCGPDEICEVPEGRCGDRDLDGVCIPRPTRCPLFFDPVCGCDGLTYSNDCERRAAGVALDHDGPCEQ